MTPKVMPEAIDHNGPLVHKWRRRSSSAWGFPEPLAEVYANRLDWHQVAKLVRRGCPVAIHE